MFLLFLLLLLLLFLLLFSFCLVNGCVMLCRASVVGAVVVVCWICHIVYTLFSLSHSLWLSCALSFRIFVFFCTFVSHSFDLQRASSVRRDVCAMPMRCAFEIRFFIRQNICLRTYLCIWGIPGKSFDRNTQCDYYCSCLSKNRVRYLYIYRIQIEATWRWL